MTPPARMPSRAVTDISDATLQRFAGYRMKRAFNVIRDDLHLVLKPFDLRMLTYTALVLIVDNPGLRQAQLADAMDVERPNVVVIVDELEQRGLIVRDPAPNDRRAYALNPTPAGEHLCATALTAVERHEERLMAGIDAETRAAMFAGLEAIRRGSDRRVK
ncbi:MAG: MarR family transcriptional regulator [Rhodobacter sp.]|nr:MarR family transcriptional regulator [Rhodobacter sp.]